jgi:rubrerythrin
MKVLFSSLLVALSLTAFAESTMGKKMNSMTGATQMDDLIRGEMAAVKSYNEVLEDIKDPKEKEALTKIKSDHEVAVSKLKSFATKDVLEDTKSAGAWGAFASVWTGGAKIMGNDAAIKALTQGEEHGIKEYKKALDDATIKPELKQMIRTQFLPKQEEHLKTIKTLM